LSYYSPTLERYLISSEKILELSPTEAKKWLRNI
jgi:hypothetical protein